MQIWKKGLSALLATAMMTAALPAALAEEGETPVSVTPGTGTVIDEPTTTTTVAPAVITVGSKVMIRQGATSYSGQKLASFAYTTVYTVASISGNRARVSRDGAVRAGINTADLILVDVTVTPVESEVVATPVVETPTTPAGIAVGARVMIRSGATTYAGNKLASFAYTNIYTVASVSGNRARVSRDGAVRAAINTADLIPMEDAETAVVAPAEPVVSTPAIAVGTKVMIRSGATTYAGNKLASFAYTNIYTVASVNGNRARVSRDGAVRAAINTADLIVVNEDGTTVDPSVESPTVTTPVVNEDGTTVNPPVESPTVTTPDEA